MRLRAHAAALAVLIPLSIAQLAQSTQNFPGEVVLRPPEGSKIKIQRPVSAVAGLDTKIFVATVSGQLYRADIKEGNGTLINTGGDDQPMGGLCLDSRGPGTLYATGRESGAVYAFNRQGELLQRYQISNLTRRPTYLSGCIQTRYQLIIIDSLNNHFYYLKLADKGPLRGHPPPPEEGYALQGYQIPYEGEWVPSGIGFNAFGVEWTARHNETAFVMNTETGELFSLTVKKKRLYGDMVKVNITGDIQKFPGALQILFDSVNENILYLSLPHMNAVAALEVSYEDPTNAKFIRMLHNPLLDGPVALSEYGGWVYAVNAKFGSESGEANYSLIQVPRHQQRLEYDGQQYTEIFDEIEITPPPIVTEPEDVEADLREPPQVMGTSAPPPLGDGSSATPPPGDTDSVPSPTTTPESSSPNEPKPSPSKGPPSVFSVDDDDDDLEENTRSCFPGAATVETLERGVIRMDCLMIGDSVVVGRQRNGSKLFSEVFLFTHQDRNIVTSFVQIESERGNTLDLSPGHYLYINGKLSAASTVKRGDFIEGEDGMSIRVTNVKLVRNKGLYNPQTLSGDIIVNGVRTSTYTSAVEPSLATALLAPVRAAYSCGTGFSRQLTSLFANGAGSLERFL